MHLIFASFLRRRMPCQQLTAFLQNNLRWGNLFVLLFLTFPSLWQLIILFISACCCRRRSSKAGLVWPRARLWDLSALIWPELRWPDWWAMITIMIVFDILSLNHYWSRGQTSYPMRVQIISQQSLKVRAYKEGSYRAVARVEEGSDSSSGRERALWWSIDQICKREGNDLPSV